MTSIDIPNIRNITISGRIGAGSTTLANGLSEKLGWKHMEGGDMFWERVRAKLGLHQKDTHKRPDKEDQTFDDILKKTLREEKNLIVETKLAGFNAQGIAGVYRILLVCEDENGEDRKDIRIDRLLNREDLSVKEAKAEIRDREQNDLEKWRRMYAGGDPNWVYWDPKYYDLIVNTYSHNKEESLSFVLRKLGIK